MNLSKKFKTARANLSYRFKVDEFTDFDDS